MLRILTAELNLHPINDTFLEFYNSLNARCMLASQKLMIRENRKIIRPFDRNDPHVPNRRHAYNQTKHHLHEGGAYYATLGNVMYAFGGLSVLYNVGNLPFLRRRNPNIIDLTFPLGMT